MLGIFGRRKKHRDPAQAVAAGDYDAAVETYRRWILEDQPRAANWRKKLAEVLVAAGRKREAVLEYLAVAEALAREDHMVQALALYRIVLRLDPHNQAVQARLGEIAADPAPPRAAGDSETPPRPPEDSATPPAAMTIRTRLRKTTPLFSSFEQDELTQIVALMTTRTFAAGELVFRQGDAADSIFFVAQGEVALTVRGRDGQPVELERLTIGGAFGEVSAVRSSARSVTAVAVSSSELLELKREYLEAVAIAHPRVWQVLEEWQRRRAAPVGV